MTASRPKIDYDQLRSSDGKQYFADSGLRAAMDAALVLGRPLLLTGEPGCGKTEFAYAIADALGVELRRSHVRSDSRARDLLYHYDALHRFGDAHHTDNLFRERSADPRNYVELLPLGVALVAGTQQVALIDEIDKAPRDLPNDLLRELERERGSFEITEIPKQSHAMTGVVTSPEGIAIQREMVRPQAAPRPIVIITSNVERQLPDAFLRRCVFYHIEFPGTELLKQILRSKTPDLPYLERFVDLFEALREERLTKKPATSELVDWATVLRERTPEELKRLAELAEQVERGGDKRPRLKSRRWVEVVGMPCLLKLREDLEAVGFGRAAGR